MDDLRVDMVTKDELADATKSFVHFVEGSTFALLCFSAVLVLP